MPNSSWGSALMVSVKRISSESTFPPQEAATAPMSTPITVETTAQTAATKILTRRPKATRTNKSCPAKSVPNQCVALGANRACDRSASCKSVPAKNGKIAA